ncbi:S41 family peptidase [Duganella sp. PWIR1]
MKSLPQRFSAMTVAVLLAACGGGSSPPAQQPVVTPPVITPPVVTPPVVTPPEPIPDDPPPVRADWLNLLNHCEAPRTGLQPNGLPYTDVQGTLQEEQRWLRAFINETYLWYSEVPTNLHRADYQTALAYFDVLKTPQTTATGRAKDRFHFTYPSATWDAMTNEGVELTYGITWQRNTDANAKRMWAIALVEPASPAALAGLRRGDTLLTVDGTSITDDSVAGTAALNAGLFPVSAGETHRLVVQRAGTTLPVSLTSQNLAMAPVQNVKVIPTASGSVGYLQFNDHNAVAEAALVNAIATLQAAGIQDLVLDMRYNGGGLLSVAGELAYMIAGPQATSGKTFEKLIANDKLPERTPNRFPTAAAGLAPALLKKGAVLPYLGLKRVTVLTTPGTCSASESVINSLRGIDIEVNLVGGETCGKPYAFVPAPNCGTTYFAIQLQGVNDKGFGDYADGFKPTCAAVDDLAREVGDPSESLLATALSYRANGVCPVTPLRNRTPSGAMQLVRPQVKEISILGR